MNANRLRKGHCNCNHNTALILWTPDGWDLSLEDKASWKRLVFMVLRGVVCIDRADLASTQRAQRC